MVMLNNQRVNIFWCFFSIKNLLPQKGVLEGCDSGAQVGQGANEPGPVGVNCSYGMLWDVMAT